MHTGFADNRADNRADPLEGGLRVKMVAALLYGEEAALGAGLEMLEGHFSALDFQGSAHRFCNTEYYSAEMGTELQRVLVAFSCLIHPAQLVEAKHKGRAVEAALARQGRRRLNVDLGYLDLFKLVLASFKARGNKLYLAQEVWADITLVYQRGRFVPLPWSFPDFASGIYQEELLHIRTRYKQQLREMAQAANHAPPKQI